MKLVNEAVETLAAFESVTGRSIRFHRVGAMRVLLSLEARGANAPRTRRSH